MKKEKVGKCMRLIKEEIQTWMQKVEMGDVEKMINFKSLMERNMLPVLNYFQIGETNAIAENINSQI